MKLNEFTDRLYAMGGITNHKNLNESFTDWAEELDYYAEKIDNFIYENEENADKVYDYVDNVLNKPNVNIGDLELEDLIKISNYIDDLNESLIEARNPENEELNDIISVTVDFASDEDEYEVINYIKQKYNIDVVDYDPTDYIENAVLRGKKSNIIKYLATEYQGYDSEEEGIDWVKDFYPELFDESLTEARNPENAEVNAVLRKWANSDRNRISKHDQKVLDDAGITLKTDKYDAPHKYAVHKDNESDIIDLHRMDKHHIKNTHPDHDLANDLATTGRHWSNKDRYNKNKDPNFPWRDDAYRSETPEESKALRPYSDEYKSLKRQAKDSEGYPYWHASAEKDLDDFKAKMAARKNESLKDLSTVKGSMTQILQDNREKIDACGSAQEVHDVVAGLLAEAELDTPATKRLLMTLKKQKGLIGALQAVYNSILKGSDLGVIKETMELAEAKQEVVSKFYTMMEEFMVDTDDQVEYLLDFIADADLQRLMDEFLEYME